MGNEELLLDSSIPPSLSLHIKSALLNIYKQCEKLCYIRKTQRVNSSLHIEFHIAAQQD